MALNKEICNQCNMPTNGAWVISGKAVYCSASCVIEKMRSTMPWAIRK